MSGKTEPKIVSQFHLSQGGAVFGYVFDPTDLERRFTVELLVDGRIVRVLVSHLHDAALEARGTGDGCYAFRDVLPATLLADARIVEARLANLGMAVDAPISLRSRPSPLDGVAGGGVQWVGGLGFHAWIADQDGAQSPQVRVLLDEVIVVHAAPTGWTNAPGCALPALSFDIRLPAEFADGRARQAVFLGPKGDPLPGSPISFIAWDDPLAEFFAARAEIEAERERARYLSLLLPRTVDFAQYDTWSKRFPRPSPSEGVDIEIAVALIGEDTGERSLRSLEVQSHERWIAGVLPQARTKFHFSRADLEGFLEGDARDARLVIFAFAGTQFEADALSHFAGAAQANPEAALIYSDILFRDRFQKNWPVFFPSFDYERMLEQGYFSFSLAMNRAHALAALARGAEDVFRLANACFDEGRASETSVVHVPAILATVPGLDLPSAASVLCEATREHLGARGIACTATPEQSSVLPAVHVIRAPEGAPVSVIVAASGDADLLRECLDSLDASLPHSAVEVIVVHPENSSEEFRSVLEGSRASVRSVRDQAGWNRSRLLNAGAVASKHPNLCFLAEDIVANRSGWLEGLVARLRDPGVGAASPLLTTSQGLIAEGGLVLGPGFQASPAFVDRLHGEPGYADMLRITRECSAVSAGCLVTTRARFQQAGGFDALRFPLALGEADFCLKLRALELRIVITPHDPLRRGAPSKPTQPIVDRELRDFRNRWRNVLEEDPYYNPQLGLDPIPFSSLAWPPRTCKARAQRRDLPVNKPPGW